MKNSTKNKDIQFSISNGAKIDSLRDICEEFNSFFAKAGQSIADSAPLSNIQPEFFLTDQNNNVPDFDLGNISPVHLSDIIKSFANKSSVDIDGISLKLFKLVRLEISIPLAHILI
jgi:hypothetical protein